MHACFRQSIGNRYGTANYVALRWVHVSSSLLLKDQISSSTKRTSEGANQIIYMVQWKKT